MEWMRVRRYLRCEEGQDLTEYALVIALVVIAAVTATQLLGVNISNILNAITTTLSSVLGGGGT